MRVLFLAILLVVGCTQGPTLSMVENLEGERANLQIYRLENPTDNMFAMDIQCGPHILNVEEMPPPGLGFLQPKTSVAFAIAVDAAKVERPMKAYCRIVKYVKW